MKSSTYYYQELDKMVANITLEDDTNIESAEYEVEWESIASGEAG